MLGEAGDDALEGEQGRDLIVGEEGRDIIGGGSGDDLIYGDGHSESLDNVRVTSSDLDSLTSLFTPAETSTTSNTNNLVLAQDPITNTANIFNHQNVQAFYQFTEGNGSLTQNLKNSNHDFNLHNGVQWLTNSDENHSTVLDFDGSDDYGTIDGLETGGAMTFSAWVNYDSFNGWSRIFDFGDAESNNNILLANKGTSKDATLEIRAANGVSGGQLTLSNFWEANTWIHVTATISDTGLMRLYKNGELAGELQSSIIPEQKVRNNNYIGRSNWSSDGHFDGKLDDVIILDSALDSNEVQSFYEDSLDSFANNAYTESVLNHQNVQAFYQFTEGNGSLTQNLKNSNHDFNLHNGVQWLTNSDENHSTVLDFDGSDDYGTIDGLETGGAMTFSAWVNYDSFNSWSRIFDFGDAQSNNNILLANKGTSKDATLEIRAANGVSGGQLTLTNFWEANTWIHVTATISDTGLMRLYKNGELAGELQSSIIPEQKVRNNNYIGRSNWSSDGHFDGQLDDVIILDSALDSNEVQSFYEDSLDSFANNSTSSNSNDTQTNINNVVLAQDPITNTGNVLDHQNLQVFYQFAEGSGGSTQNLKSSNYDLNLYSQVEWVTNSQKTHSTILDFHSDSVESDYGFINDLETGGAMTFSAWVNYDSFQDGSRIFSFGDQTGADNSSANNVNRMWLANTGHSNDLNFRIYGSDGVTFSEIEIDNFWETDSWIHVTASVDETGLMRVYKNGELAGEFNGGVVPVKKIRAHNYLGAGDAYHNSFDGQLDDVMIFDAALDSNEVQSFYENSLNSLSSNTTSSDTNNLVLAQDPIRVEAESLNWSGSYTQTNENYASGGSLIQNTTTNSLITGSGTFTGETGVYDIVVGYHDNNYYGGGINVQVNYTAFDSVEFFQNPDNGNLGAGNAKTHTIRNVSINENDPFYLQIFVEGLDNGERALDYIQFVPVVTEPEPAPEPTPYELPPGETYNGSHYVVLDTSMTWNEAQAYAESIGGNLVTINDATEEQWLSDTFSSYNKRFWIGINDETQEGEFQWVNGEAVTYTNWRDGYPNGTTSNEKDHGVVNYYSGNGKWEDRSLTSTHSSIIEIPLSESEPEPTPYELPNGVNLGESSDILRGGFGNDGIDGGEGNDIIFGEDEYDDSSYGGNDTILGGLGDDLVYGNSGNDLIYGDTHTSVNSGLVAHLAFDEGTGTEASNSASDERAFLVGALYNDVTWTDGKTGKGINFSGDYGSVGISHNDAVDITDTITLSAWIKADTIDDGDGIINKGYRYDYAYGMNLTAGGNLVFKTSSGEWQSNSQINTGQWHHVAVSYDGSEIKFYIDGQEDSNVISTNITLTSTPDNLVSIGHDNEINGGSAVWNYFDGIIDDPRIHNRALSATEIAELASLESDLGVVGEDGNDNLIGNGGDDTLTGGAGNDTLNGTDDVLAGYLERDILTGGAGADRFILGDATQAYYGTEGNQDYATITDFDTSEDVVQLYGSASNYSQQGNDLYYNGDLVGIFEGSTSWDLNSNAFEYV